MQKKSIIAASTVAGVALTGAIIVGTNAFAESPTASPTASTTPSQGTEGRQKGQGGGQRGGSQDTAVAGTEAQKVIDAVQAKNTGVTITEVRKDPDGSYDALGTKSDGTKVFYDVSADLGTITEHTR